MPKNKKKPNKDAYLEAQNLNLGLSDAQMNIFNKIMRFKPTEELTTFEIEVSKVEANEIARICQIINANTKITKIKFIHEPQSDEIVQAIATGLKTNNSINELDMSECTFSDVGGEYVRTLLTEKSQYNQTWL